MNLLKSNLQHFAAPSNLTGQAQIQTKAREIDFVTSFSKNMQALLDVMGISRMIRKENGSKLSVKTASGTLQSGDVAEGEEIPLSQYQVIETVYDTLKIEKYRKAVSIEAVAEKGYDVAVQMTDDEFKSDLQNTVTAKFYKQLKSGSLVGHESTWQMAVAMAIGKVIDKFQKMHRTATDVALWVNTLDLYKYVGGANITIQSAFGFKYIENFMGAKVTFVSSEIPENTVIATPLNNIVAYYVDPADSEFSRAGLSYTTDGTTGFIGFHTQGNYDRAISDMFAIMGVRIFCEYLDAIAYIAVGAADTQTLNTLTASTVVGSATGKQVVTVDEGLSGMHNTYKIKVAASATDVTYGMDVKSWTKWDGVSEIDAAAAKVITIVECDGNYKAVASGTVTAV